MQNNWHIYIYIVTHWSLLKCQMLHCKNSQYLSPTENDRAWTWHSHPRWKTLVCPHHNLLSLQLLVLQLKRSCSHGIAPHSCNGQWSPLNRPLAQWLGIWHTGSGTWTIHLLCGHTERKKFRVSSTVFMPTKCSVEVNRTRHFTKWLASRLTRWLTGT
jgi:hypothetical protein